MINASWRPETHDQRDLGLRCELIADGPARGTVGRAPAGGVRLVGACRAADLRPATRQVNALGHGKRVARDDNRLGLESSRCWSARHQAVGDGVLTAMARTIDLAFVDGGHHAAQVCADGIECLECSRGRLRHYDPLVLEDRPAVDRNIRRCERRTCGRRRTRTASRAAAGRGGRTAGAGLVAAGCESSHRHSSHRRSRPGAQQKGTPRGTSSGRYRLGRTVATLVTIRHGLPFVRSVAPRSVTRGHVGMGSSKPHPCLSTLLSLRHGLPCWLASRPGT
jgi:hypothetical protein